LKPSIFMISRGRSPGSTTKMVVHQLAKVSVPMLLPRMRMKASSWPAADVRSRLSAPGADVAQPVAAPRLPSPAAARAVRRFSAIKTLSNEWLIQLKSCPYNS
jgi:hypothetical protein